MDGKLKILIVDDSPLVAPRIRSLLDSLQHDITIGEAVSAEEASGLMEEVIPDIVLLDINMPGRNGVELLTEIKSKYPFMTVIVFTNHADAYHRNICKELGADHFLDKSTEFEMIPKILQDMVEAPVLVD